MSESKDPPRISFSKDRVENHLKGASGITGTSKRMVEPTSEIDADICESGSINYNASELLFKNLDALGSKLNLNPEEKTEIVEEPIDEECSEKWGADMLENLSEEDVIANLDQHLGYNGSPEASWGRPTTPVPVNGRAQGFQAPPGKLAPIPTPQQSGKDVFCRSCGGKYLATDNFCGGCGYKRA
jgi:hypothetical protein